jgi:hypothetical protein
MTPVAKYNLAGPGFFGFDPKHSKTGIFRVQLGTPQGQTIFRGRTFYDANADGILGPQELPLAGWRVEIYKNGVFQDVRFSDENGDYAFIRDLDFTLYSFRAVAPGGYIGNNTPGSIWLSTNQREFSASTTQPIVQLSAIGNISYEVAVGLGLNPEFWQGNSGEAMMQAAEPAWREHLAFWKGSPLCLRRNISTYDPNISIYKPPTLPTSFLAARAHFVSWITSPPDNHAGFMLSIQVASAVLNRRIGNMQFRAYIDRFNNGILVSFDDIDSGAQQMLLCQPGAGMTGPNDPEQKLRARMLGCTTEFGTINNSGDPDSPQPVFAARPSAAGFVTPYSN